MTETPDIRFDQLGLHPAIQSAIDAVGYEKPSPIQAQAIPLLLEGRDVVGQAQTGTGKTAAFALPLLSRLDLKQGTPQLLVLTPTRELAIQVAEAFGSYAAKLKGFHVLPLYGGQEYHSQIKALKRGVHVVVGTPGRVMDHMRKGTLQLQDLRGLVLDEADEMLRMGFIDDVEWVLGQTPPQRQIALFSATMPRQIRAIAERHLNNPEHITIRQKTTTAETIRQRYWLVSGMAKLDALTRILEAEPFDAIIVFVRTKIATVELSDKLKARGYAASPLSGEIPQAQRERTVEQLKRGKIDMIVATDVAARGLDVERVSHVINYDVPYDTEAYVHRIGRTGRAGRSGDAILFVAPRERRMLRAIEHATGKQIELMSLPSAEAINDLRVERFFQRLRDAMGTGDSARFLPLIEQFQQQQNVPATEIAAALAQLLQGDTPFFLEKRPKRKEPVPSERKESKAPASDKKPKKSKKRKAREQAEQQDMVRYRIEVGKQHDAKPGNIMGAIANEAGLDGKHIGRIEIRDDHSFVDLPDGMPKEIFQDLKKARVAGQPLQISRVSPKGKRPAN